MNLREQLQAIYDQHGRLTPSLVVDTARADDHPLHHRLEWNNDIAGEKYRQIQAAELIRSVKIQWVQGEEKSEVRAFHAVREEHRFEPIEQIMYDSLSRAILLRQAEREWKAMHRRFKHLKAFLEIVRSDVA